jgi:hypothetical protein
MDRFEIRGNREAEVQVKKFSDPPRMSVRKREMGVLLEMQRQTSN